MAESVYRDLDYDDRLKQMGSHYNVPDSSGRVQQMGKMHYTEHYIAYIMSGVLETYHIEVPHERCPTHKHSFQVAFAVRRFL